MGGGIVPGLGNIFFNVIYVFTSPDFRSVEIMIHGPELNIAFSSLMHWIFYPVRLTFRASEVYLCNSPFEFDLKTL